MPRGKHVKLIIGVDGSCSVDAVNFTGLSCQNRGAGGCSVAGWSD